MNNAPSRRNSLAAGLTLPGVASASRTAEQSQPQPPARPSSGAALQYRTLGKTGLRVTTVGYGCMITSDPTVITRAVDMGINYFDTSRNYQGGQNERMVGAALEPGGKTFSWRRNAIRTRDRVSSGNSTPALRNSAPTTWTSGTFTAWAIRRRLPTNWWRPSARPSRRARSASSG